MMIRYRRKEVLSVKDALKKVKIYLTNLGFDFKLLGSSYLGYIITFILIFPTHLANLKRKVIEPLSDIFNTSANIMEKNIMWAIKKAHTRGEISKIASHPYKNYPSIKILLNIVYDHLIINEFFNVEFILPEDGNILKELLIESY